MEDNYGLDAETMEQIKRTSEAFAALGLSAQEASEKILECLRSMVNSFFLSKAWIDAMKVFGKNRPERKLTILHKNTVKKLIGHLPDYRRNVGS